MVTNRDFIYFSTYINENNVCYVEFNANNENDIEKIIKFKLKAPERIYVKKGLRYGSTCPLFIFYNNFRTINF